MAKVDRLKYYRFLRKRVEQYEKLFAEFIKRVINDLRDKATLILFGSRAREDHKESSDFDLMVIIERGEMEKISLEEKLYRMKPRQVPIDILVIYDDELNNDVIKKMLTTGKKIIYDGLGLFKKKIS
ncbi:MAG: nucleotidyltransferase domain-containing protein [Candidatus Njordarchaeales archaeon]